MRQSFSFALAGALMFSALLSTASARAADEQASPPPHIIWRAAQDAYLTENIKRPEWKQTNEGLQYRVEKQASGDEPRPAPGSEVTVHYEGRLITGHLFDSSYERGAPSTFSLGRVISGWQIGVPMMRKGETWWFVIPASLAYGERDAGRIPAGSTLIFKIQLLDVTTPAA